MSKLKTKRIRGKYIFASQYADNFNNAFNEIEKDNIPILITDHYRTKKQQANLNKKKPTLAVAAGKSKHEKGEAVDFGDTIIYAVKKELGRKPQNTKEIYTSNTYKNIKAIMEENGLYNPFEEKVLADKPSKAEYWHWEVKKDGKGNTIYSPRPKPILNIEPSQMDYSLLQDNMLHIKSPNDNIIITESPMEQAPGLLKHNKMIRPSSVVQLLTKKINPYV